MLIITSKISPEVLERSKQLPQPKLIGQNGRAENKELIWSVKSSRSDHFYRVYMSIDRQAQRDLCCLSFIFRCSCKAGSARVVCNHAVRVRSEAANEFQRFADLLTLRSEEPVFYQDLSKMLKEKRHGRV